MTNSKLATGREALRCCTVLHCRRADAASTSFDHRDSRAGGCPPAASRATRPANADVERLGGKGAQAELRALEACDRAQAAALSSFVARCRRRRRPTSRRSRRSAGLTGAMAEFARSMRARSGDWQPAPRRQPRDEVAGGSPGDSSRAPRRWFSRRVRAVSSRLPIPPICRSSGSPTGRNAALRSCKSATSRSQLLGVAAA